YATRLVAESESTSVCPPSVGGECALGMDVLEDRQEEFECFAASVPHLVSMLIAPEGDPDSPDMPTPCSYVEAIEGPYSSQWQAAMDIEMPSWKSTGTYVDEVPPPGANIVSGMWIFRVKWPPGSPPVFKARYVARGFSQRQGAPREWHDTRRTTLAALGFAPSTSDPSLFLRTGTTLPPFYVLVYVEDLVFATADTEALAHVKSKLQKRHTCTDLGELTSYLGLRITRDRAHRTITLTQSHMVQQVLQRFGFMYSSPQSTPLPTGHSLSAPPSDESVEPSGPYPELVGCLMYLMTCTRPDLAYPLSLLARYVAPDRHQKSTRSSSVLSSSCEAEIYARAMAAQELRWLTYLLTDLGEAPRSPPVLYVDNKAMLALCREHRLEHRTKHIALRYFLARELQQRGQLRLAYDTQEDFECFASAIPHLVAMLLAPEGDPDAPDISTSRSYAEAITCPYSSQWHTAMDAEMASWMLTSTYVDVVPPSGANIVDVMWIFRMKRPPGSPPVFKARYIARGFSQRLGVEFFQTFSPTSKMTTLRVLLHVAVQRDYELHSRDMSTTFLQGSLHEEIWLRCPPGLTGSFPAALGFAPSTADPSLFLRTNSSLPPFYVLVYVLQRFGFTYSSPQSTPLPTGHSLSTTPSDESVEPSGPYPELVGCLMYLMTCT
ncbi:unnamed protein product, partial [Closterium sp. NIES-53]